MTDKNPKTMKEERTEDELVEKERKGKAKPETIKSKDGVRAQHFHLMLLEAGGE